MKDMQKYKNKKVTVNGLSFDSKKEANRYIKLLEKQQNGEIRGLETQVKYILIPAQYEPDRVGVRGGKIKGKCIERECAYIADFRYIDNSTGETVVEDVKGYRMKGAYNLFTVKRKLMFYVHGIRIKEV